MSITRTIPMALAIWALLFSVQTGVLPNRAPPATPAPATVATAQFKESAEYPRTLAFRTLVEVPAGRGTPIQQVFDAVAPYDMIIAHGLDDENLATLKTAPYLQAIKARFPSKPVLDHFLLRERNPLSTHPTVFPGHWLLLNGTTLAADAPADRQANVLEVTDSSTLRVGEGTQVTPLDATNQPDWDHTEQVRVLAIAGNQVTVERGAYGSQLQAFSAGRARVAAHAWTEYNTATGPLWRYNFCREAPRDGKGHRLIEALAGELASYLAPGAVLGGLDGYQFDVTSFWAGSKDQGARRVDCDNDGSPDSGFIDNVSSYGLGVVDFFAALRQRVGPDIMLVSEATGDWSSRTFASSNGIKNESFPDWHHWELFSSAYQRYQFWNQRALKPNLSYLQVKEPSEAFTKCPDRDRGTNWKYRLPMGAALLGNGYLEIPPPHGRCASGQRLFCLSPYRRVRQ